MLKNELHNLSRRERQIMDVLFADGARSAQEVLDKLPDPPSYSAVRALIARLVDKGFVTFCKKGSKHIYSPAMSESRARGSALTRLVKTFFKGSRSSAVTALLDMDELDMSTRELETIERKIKQLKSIAKH